MDRGELSSHALTRAYLDRIAAIDDAGPTLNAVIELNPDALKEADARDAERKAGRVRGRCTASRAAQGQHRRHADGEFRRLAGAGPQPRATTLRRRAPARPVR
jgi:hypothetical protein